MDIPHSDRLCFSYVTASDADFLWQLDQDEEVMKYLTKGKKTSRKDIDEIFLPRIEAFSQQEKGWGLWKVALKAYSTYPVGWILVRPFGFFTGEKDESNLELGWRFERRCWGQGIATEAATAVRDLLFTETGTAHYSAITLPDNGPSISVMKKLGMVYSHEFRYKDEVFDDITVVYSQTLATTR